MCVNSRQNLSRDITICRIYQVRLWSLYVLWHISVGYHKTLLSPSLFFLPRKHLKECTCAPRCVCFEDFHSLPIWSWCICKIWRKLWFLCTKLKVLPSLADSFTALLACGQWCSGRHWPFRHQSPVSCVCFPFHRRRTKSSFKFHCRGSFGRHQQNFCFRATRAAKTKIGRHDETWVPSHWLPYPDPCYLGGKFLFQARQSFTTKVFAVSVQIRPVDPQLHYIPRKSRFQSVFLFGWFFLQFSSCALSCSQV